ncbi:Ribosomal RNA large subunit methyltransferase H [uncultured archaeon]|nr:Ribosomal RNA large subunit methyltransferase H [uncultured archaeon]
MISILSIGSNKMFKPQELEYLARINRFIRAEVVEIKEDKSQREEEVIRKEGMALLAKIKDKKFFALDPKGITLSTESFAQLIRGRNDLIFVIGGANGLSEDVKKRAEKIISLSAMTFTHEIARVLILEQIYRALTIQKGMKYHK